MNLGGFYALLQIIQNFKLGVEKRKQKVYHFVVPKKSLCGGGMLFVTIEMALEVHGQQTQAVCCGVGSFSDYFGYAGGQPEAFTNADRQRHYAAGHDPAASHFGGNAPCSDYSADAALPHGRLS